MQKTKKTEDTSTQTDMKKGLISQTFHTATVVDLELVKNKFRQDIYTVKDCGKQKDVCQYKVLYEKDFYVGFFCNNTPNDGKYKVIVYSQDKKTIDSSFALLTGSPVIKTSYQAIIAHFQSIRRFKVVDELKANLQKFVDKKIDPEFFNEETHNILKKAKETELQASRKRSASSLTNPIGNTNGSKRLRCEPLATTVINRPNIVNPSIYSQRIQMVEDERKNPLLHLVQNSRIPPLNWPGTSIQFTEEYKTDLGRFYVVNVAIHVPAEKIPFLSPWIQESCRKFNIEKNKILKERAEREMKQKEQEKK